MFASPQTVPAIVLDVGSRTTKAGFAGADLPQSLFPSSVGSYISEGGSLEGTPAKPLANTVFAGYENLLGSAERVRFLELRTAFDDDGIIQDWAAYEGLLDYTFHQLRASPEEYALLLVEASHNPKRPREELCQVLFEKYGVPAVYFGRSAALACVAAGRHTGVVLDCGASGVTATPVVEGNVMKQAILRSRVAGGNALTRAAAELLGGFDAVRPAYAFRRRALGRGTNKRDAADPEAATEELAAAASTDGSSSSEEADDRVDLIGGRTPDTESAASVAEGRMEFRIEPLDVHGVTRSYDEYARIEVVEDFKHHVCCVNREPSSVEDVAEDGTASNAVSWETRKADDEGLAGQPADPDIPPIRYELPDGTLVSIGAERYRPAEILFKTLPHARTIKEDRPFLAYIRERERGPSSSKGLAGMVADTIQRCEGAQHREMYAGVILTGGSSVLPGLSDRLQTELYFYHSRSKIHAAANPMERKYMAWTGGSILATFMDFQQNWFSRAEYLESGVSLVQKRCP